MSVVAAPALDLQAARGVAAAPAARAERVIVISLQKAGTHLIVELMHALGYGLHGAAKMTPEIMPRFDRTTRKAIANLVFGPLDRARLAAAAPFGGFTKLTDAAWETLAWSWRQRLGLQLVNQYDQATVDRLCRPADLARLARTRFADTPANLCWIFHELDAAKVDGAFLQEWTGTGAPAVIFHYRDPRDVLLSFVNYLSGRTAQGFGGFSHYRPFHKTLIDLPDLAAQLSYAIADPSFPGHDDFAKSLWLLRSPLVCKTSFEELVGTGGGGTAAAQSAVVGRVMRHLSIQGEPQEVAERLFRRDAFTFFRGRIGGWRQAFGEEHRRAFRRAFADLPEQYGYADT
jgi:hypothetical protein